MRRLQILPSGRWYLALTLGLGIAALSTANNVLYLVESLLLSGIILSGILSERTVLALRCERIKGKAIAGETSGDTFRVTNTRRFTVFCVQVGEWKQGQFIPLFYIPRIQKGLQAVFSSHQIFQS